MTEEEDRRVARSQVKAFIVAALSNSAADVKAQPHRAFDIISEAILDQLSQPQSAWALRELARSQREVLMDEQRAVMIDYTNHKGERSLRRITPRRFFWGSNQYHPDPQWLVEATAHDREGATRVFALSHVHQWGVI